MIRHNSYGIEFTVIDKNNQTLIQLGDKSIIINEKPERILFDWYRWNRGLLIQEAFPYLSSDEREFLISGTTKQEWDQMFPTEQS